MSRKQANGGSFLALAFMAVFALFALRPAPASACCCADCIVGIQAETGEVTAQEGAIYGELGSILSAIYRFMQDFTNGNDMQIIANALSSMLSDMIKYFSMQEKKDHVEHLTFADYFARETANAKVASTMMGSLCNNNKVQTAALVARSRFSQVAGTEGITSRASYGAPGNGTGYAVDIYNLICNPKLPTGSPDSYEKKCVPSDEEFINASSTIKFFLDPEFILEQPKVKASNAGPQNSPIQLKEFDLDHATKEQKRYVAAWQACYVLAGPRPSPSGVKNTDGDAISCRAITARCQMMESAAINPCLARLDKLARPDCSDQKNKVKCDAQKDACLAAAARFKDSGGLAQMPVIYKDCAAGKGMSEYASDRLMHLMCASSELYKQLLASSPGVEGALQLQVQCSTLRIASEIKQTLDMNSLSSSAADMESVSRCWASAASVCHGQDIHKKL